MRSPSYITGNFTTETQKHGGRPSKSKNVKAKNSLLSFTFLLFIFYSIRSVPLCLCGIFCVLALPISAQRIAIITPEQTEQTKRYASQLTDTLSKRLNVLDDEMSRSAFVSVKAENPLNLTTIQAKGIGEVIGCEYFLLVRSETLRRSSLNRDEYYESYVTIFLVSARSGHLVYWDLKSFEADKPAESERLLFTSTDTFALEIGERLESSRKSSLPASGETRIEEVPSADSPTAKNFHPPMPYKRIKPEYTRKAYLYDIRATVDVLVDIDQAGAVAAVWIERWAGFGLDESVIETVRKMNWRPAERNGKTLPMRVLLRYNFTKIEKE